MKKTTLVIMAAGIGSRFGGGIKQLEPIDEQGHIIMDYSIHDAIKAGFDKVIFIIRKDIEKDFKEIIGDRIEAVCSKSGVEVAYCFQDMQDIPAGYSVPVERTKPWGTGQAILAARDAIDSPFAVINADDYYGTQAFGVLHEWLTIEHGNNEASLVGFILKNTLSENGSVTRGVCKVDSNGYLLDIQETSDIIRTSDGVTGSYGPLSEDISVSMNMWGFGPAYIDALKTGFEDFFRDKVADNPLKAEYLLPTHVGELLKEGKISVKVLNSSDKWFGVTYKEDKPDVVKNINELISKGIYSEDLYSDLI